MRDSSIGVSRFKLFNDIPAFLDAAFQWLMLFVASQACLIVLGLLPMRMWKSFKSQAAVAATPARRAGRRKNSPAPASL